MRVVKYSCSTARQSIPERHVLKMTGKQPGMEIPAKRTETTGCKCQRPHSVEAVLTTATAHRCCSHEHTLQLRQHGVGFRQDLCLGCHLLQQAGGQHKVAKVIGACNVRATKCQLIRIVHDCPDWCCGPHMYVITSSSASSSDRWQ
jgi:hypothetical protein